MKCPVCRQETRVLGKDAAQRRRQCTGCGHRFTTTEVLTDELKRRERILEDAKALAGKLQEGL